MISLDRHMTPRANISSPLPIASLWRRLAAIIYDLIILFAVWLIIAAVAYTLFGESIQYGIGRSFFGSLLFIATFSYFAYFWLHGGQTTGMRAWRLQLRNEDGLRGITLWQALLRFIVALSSGLLFGLGFLWMLVDRRRMTWHDRYSETQLFMVSAPSAPRPEKQK